ncbi:MAG: HAD family phosphatase [Ferruginibacter sp.]|nr:HAD family phosphatase [Ferruginibacter sp.]
MENLKNILFDFGGVLYDLDYHLTIDAFAALGYTGFEDAFSQYKANRFFEDFETGRIDESTFYSTLQAIPAVPPTIPQIKKAWNAMMLGFRMNSLAFLKTLSSKYNLYLLSNTNIIHKRRFDDELFYSTGLSSMDVLFEKAYYSHLIGKRKPHQDVFKYVLGDAEILAEETLFVEDTLPNLESAMQLGFKGLLLKPKELIEDKLDYLISSKSI